MVDKLIPNDPRVKYEKADVNGSTYTYILGEPKDVTPVATIFLIHGFPDMAFGWRYQIPFLLSLNLRVVVPNMKGYAGTSAPEAAQEYTFKKAADDMVALAAHLGVSSIILGGHDWGGAVVYRIVLHYPKFVSALFSVCTPFWPPRSQYVQMAKVLPNFKYQLQLRGPDVEREIVGEKKIRELLNALYGARGPNGEVGFTTDPGAIFENLPILRQTPLLSTEELDHYVEKFSINGMHGPLNWYRTPEFNHEDEKHLAPDFEKGFRIQVPTLFIAGKRDSALPPSMSDNMEKYFAEGGLRREMVDTTHWALWEKPEEVNGYIGSFITDFLGSKSKM